MSRLWQTLETLPGPAAVPAVWKAGLGDEFDRFRSAFLRTRPKPAMSYPCPHDCGCAHEIVRHKSGKIVAVCQCDPSSCNDIPLTESDCVVLELNWSALGRSVAAALGLTGREADLGVRDALQIAVSGGHALPVVLVICNDREAFLHAVEALLARLGGSFMVVAPTADFVDGSVQQLFSGANARFVPLDRSVRISDTGVMSPIESASGPGVSKKRGWDGLRIGEIFEPQTMLWNGKPFQIEEPAACFKGYDLENVSLESYFPDLNDNWHEAIKDVPFDEVENLRVLRLIGFDKTLEIQIMLKDSEPVYPERLESSGETDGWHEGGVLFVFGEAFHIKGLRVEPTEPTVRAKIDAARRARRPVVEQDKIAVEPPAIVGGGVEKGEIIGDYQTIRVGRREIDLSRKFKARNVFRFLHARMKDTDGVFLSEEIKEDFNAQFGKGQEKRQWKSDRFREDLFKGMPKEDFDCLFETLDQTAGRYRLKI